MKTIISSFHYTDFSTLIGYKHGELIPYEDTFRVAEEIFSKGLNVQILHTTMEEYKCILFVDKYNFKQR